MRLLSLDTSFSFMNLSVIEEGRISLLYYEDSGKKSLELLPLVLSKLSLRPEDFDGFAVSVGVGYLTSLRIGITFVKTIAYLTKKPIYTYENLELMLRHSPAKTALLKVSKNIFYRTYDEKGISPIRLWKGEKLIGPSVALRVHSIEFADYLLDFFPFSAYGGLHAYKRLLAGDKGEDPFSLEPYYTNPS